MGLNKGWNMRHMLISIALVCCLSGCDVCVRPYPLNYVGDEQAKKVDDRIDWYVRECIEEERARALSDRHRTEKFLSGYCENRFALHRFYGKYPRTGEAGGF